MSRRTTRRPGRRPPDQHPSIWFFVALAAGIIFVVWIFAHVATKPAPPPPATTTTRKG
jgi:hypothetical protein